MKPPRTIFNLFVLLALLTMSLPATDAQATGTMKAPILPYGWTIEMMRNAIPYPMPEAGLAGESSGSNPLEVTVQAAGAPGWMPSIPPDGWTDPLVINNPPVTVPPPGFVPTMDNVTDFVPEPDHTQFPYSAAGKVFFMSGEHPYMCSAAVIAENAVWTASHCVIDGLGNFHSAWFFIPAFYNAQEPYGAYVQAYGVVTTEWAYGFETDPGVLDDDVRFDYAIVGVKPLVPDGQAIRQKTGALGFGWNLPRQQNWKLLGYPVNYGGGFQMAYSDSTYFVDGLLSDPDTVGVGSNMIGGASGGPWMLNFMAGAAGEANYLNGTNSYINNTGALFSPYFDDRAKRLWDCAQNSTLEQVHCIDGNAGANLLLTQSASGNPLQQGALFTYTLTVQNLGPGDATNVVITDQLPAPLDVVSFVNAELPGGTCTFDQNSGAVTCNLDTLPNGATATATLVVAAPAYDALLFNAASVEFDQQGDWVYQVVSDTTVGSLPCTPAITVANANDAGAGSLRQAIADACPGGTIDFDPSLSGDTIHLASPLMPANVTIDGSALAEPITLSGDTDNDGTGDTRVFYTHNVTLDSLTITKGKTNFNGGGIYNSGALTLIASTLSSNSAGQEGGGIYNIGQATLTGSTLAANSAVIWGGGISNNISGASVGDLVIANSTLSGNSADAAGAIDNYGTLTLKNSTLSGNSAPNGGGIYINPSGVLNYANTILANSASGGDCYNDGGVIGANRNNLVEDGGCADGGANFKTGDPKLGPLADNGGPTRTLGLLADSPAIGAGNNAICAASPVNNLDQRGVARPQGANCDIGAYEIVLTTATFRSAGTYDGWVLEATENSTLGGTLDKTAATFRLGDETWNRQYRAILHFNTDSLPNTAVITKVTLKIKQQGLVGTNPFTLLGGLKVDTSKPFFGTTLTLITSDFQAAAGKSAVATFGATPASNWYSAVLNATGRAYINLTGTTQFRLRFLTDDNNNNSADYMKFYSGNTATDSAKPTLIIEYFVP